MKQNLKEYGEGELSLLVFNDESLYNNRFKEWFIDDLNELFDFTEEQLEELKNDLEKDLKESE